MEIEFKNKRDEVLLSQSLRTMGDRYLESIIVHLGKTEEESNALWSLIEDALSKDIAIICREDGYYILSREATGSLPHTTYEFMSKGKDETTTILVLIDKHLEGK